VDQHEKHHKIFEAGSVDNGPDRSSLISNLDSDGDNNDDDDDQAPQDLTADDIIRWFKRGSSMLENETRVETLLERMLNMEIYAKRWKRLNLVRLARSEQQPERVISLDSED
jgi:hypothetical protein